MRGPADHDVDDFFETDVDGPAYIDGSGCTGLHDLVVGSLDPYWKCGSVKVGDGACHSDYFHINDLKM